MATKKQQQSRLISFCKLWAPSECLANQLAQQYYLQVKYYFSCRLDGEAEAEQLAREAIRIATSNPNQNRLHRIDDLLLSIATDLLRQRWLKSDERGLVCSAGLEKPIYSLYSPSTDDLQGQATSLYIKLRALQGNPVAAAEISATIHHWIGNDPQRQAAYDRVRRMWYRKGEHGRPEVSPKAHSTIRNTAGAVSVSCGDTRASVSPITLSWPDVVLLVFVIMLLLPMIYLLAMPVGGRI